MTKRRLASYGLNLVGVALLYALFTLAFACNAFGKSTTYIQGICTTACYTIIMVTSLNLVVGFMGEFSMGHAGFVSVGAYVSAIVSGALAGHGLSDLALLLVAILAGGLAAGIMGVAVGIPALRLRGDYLAIVTMAFAEIIRVVIVNATSITNGSLGIKGIPGEATLLTCYIWTVITLVVLSRLIFSNFGNVLRCIRDNEIAAGVMGINVFRYKVLSFCVGAFFAGVGGALLGSHLSTIDPKMFNFLLTFNVLMFVVAGGLGSLTGSLLGATIVTILLEWLRAIEEPMDFGVFEIPGIPGMRMVVFSLILLAIILFRREGIMGTREITWKTIFSLGRRKA